MSCSAGKSAGRSRTWGRRAVGRRQALLRQADLVVANLECVDLERRPAVAGQAHPPAGARWRPRTRWSRVESTSSAWPTTTLSTSGAEAFTDELAAARRTGHRIRRRRSQRETRPTRRRIVEQNGLRIAFLGYVLPILGQVHLQHARLGGHGETALAWPSGRPTRCAATWGWRARRRDLVVVMVHGGLEYRGKPSAAQRTFADAATGRRSKPRPGPSSARAAGLRAPRRPLIAFSLGNFVFARFDGRSNDSAILDVTLTPDGVASLDWIPVVIADGIPRPATAAEARRIMDGCLRFEHGWRLGDGPCC